MMKRKSPMNGNDYRGKLDGITINKFTGGTEAQWKFEVTIPESGKKQIKLRFLRRRTDSDKRLVANAICHYLDSPQGRAQTKEAREECEKFIACLTPYGIRSPPPF
jgi:hypothetical protein